MWAWWGKQFHEPKCGSGHVCQVMAWTRHQGLVPFKSFWERPRTGGRGAASLGHSPHSSIFSPTDVRLWTSTAQSEVLRAPSAGCWFSLQHLISNRLELPVYRVILLFYAHSIQPVNSQGYPLDTFDRMHLLFTQVHFLFWLLGRGQYATIPIHYLNYLRTWLHIENYYFPIQKFFFFLIWFWMSGRQGR